MKGMLEVRFPSMDAQRSNENAGMFRWTGGASSRKPKKRGGVVGYLYSAPVDEYFQLLKQEEQLKRANPEWRVFQPTRACVRLGSGWLRSRESAESFFCSLEDFISSVSPVLKLPYEVVVPGVDALHLDQVDIDAQFLTLTGLEEQNAFEKVSAQREVLQEVSLRQSLGIEFQVGKHSIEREQLRRQIQLTSLIQPKFIRIVHQSGKGSNFFRPAMNEELSKSCARSVKLAIEAYETLGYEPIALYPHALVLSACPSVERKLLRVPQRVLGLGGGARSFRVDKLGRTVCSKNSDTYADYCFETDKQWKNRDLVALAQATPYLHDAIERALKADDGLCYETIRAQFGVDLEQLRPGLSRMLSEAGFTEKEEGKVRVSSSAKEYTQEVMWNFFMKEQDFQLAA